VYRFWARPTLSWDLKCDNEHPHTTVVQAADKVKAKQPLNEGAVVALSIIAIATGTVVSFFVMTLFLAGKCRKDSCGNGLTMGLTSVGLMSQLVLFTIVFLLVLG
jgi:hypothetical protein